MKKSVIFLICLIVSFMVFGQNETKNLMVDIEEVEVTPPKFTGIENVVAKLPGNRSDLISGYLSKNVVYPKRAMNLRKEGTEVVQFVITPSGELRDFKVINSVCPEIDFELISVLKRTNGMWNPGYNNGEPVAMQKEVSMVFNLGEYKNRTVKEKFTAIATSFFTKGTKKLFIENNPKKALKYFEMAMMYLPNDESLLYSRGMVKYELEDKEGAQSDWDRMKLLAEKGTIEKNIEFTANNYKQLKGFEELQNHIGK
jgi:TonB family protein